MEKQYMVARVVEWIKRRPVFCIFGFVMFIWFYMAFISPRPFWALGSEESDYLYSALVYIKTGEVLNYHHPGGILLWLAAVPIYFYGSDLADTQAIFNWYYLLVALAFATALTVFARTALRNISFLGKLMAVCAIVGWPMFLLYINHFTSDPFMYCELLIASSLFWYAMNLPKLQRAVNWWLGGAGFFYGLAITCKFTSLPMAAVYVFALAIFVHAQPIRQMIKWFVYGVGGLLVGMVIGLGPSSRNVIDVLGMVLHGANKEGSPMLYRDLLPGLWLQLHQRLPLISLTIWLSIGFCVLVILHWLYRQWSREITTLPILRRLVAEPLRLVEAAARLTLLFLLAYVLFRLLGYHYQIDLARHPEFFTQLGNNITGAVGSRAWSFLFKAGRMPYYRLLFFFLVLGGLLWGLSYFLRRLLNRIGVKSDPVGHYGKQAFLLGITGVVLYFATFTSFNSLDGLETRYAWPGTLILPFLIVFIFEYVTENRLLNRGAIVRALNGLVIAILFVSMGLWISLYMSERKADLKLNAKLLDITKKAVRGNATADQRIAIFPGVGWGAEGFHHWGNYRFGHSRFDIALRDSSQEYYFFKLESFGSILERTERPADEAIVRDPAGPPLHSILVPESSLRSTLEGRLGGMSIDDFQKILERSLGPLRMNAEIFPYWEREYNEQTLWWRVKAKRLQRQMTFVRFTIDGGMAEASGL